MQKLPITREGFARLKRELDHCKNVLVPANVRDIETARAHGDLSENAEYAAAKEMQAFIHAKIAELENKLALSEIIDTTGLATDEVVFGLTVLIDDLDTGKRIEYQLVGPYESDINENKISITSPIGRAMIGKSVGDIIKVKTPGGIRELELIDIYLGQAGA
jgi:transcription elongation factor GreA